MTTTLSPNGNPGAADTSVSPGGGPPAPPDASETAKTSGSRSKTRATKEEGVDISGFFEKLRARTEAAKVKKLKVDIARRAKDLVAALDLGITANELAGDVVDAAPFYKDVPKNMVVAAIEEIVEKERAKNK